MWCPIFIRKYEVMTHLKAIFQFLTVECNNYKSTLFSQNPSASLQELSVILRLHFFRQKILLQMNIKLDLKSTDFYFSQRYISIIWCRIRASCMAHMSWRPRAWRKPAELNRTWNKVKLIKWKYSAKLKYFLNNSTKSIHFWVYNL